MGERLINVFQYVAIIQKYGKVLKIRFPIFYLVNEIDFD